MSERRSCVIFVRADMTCRAFSTPAAAIGTGTLRAPGPPLDVYTNVDDLLPAVLSEGWVPVRETSLGNGDAILVFEKSS
ncbi:MAG: hypothetical protein KDA96_10640 [Planctomycetaceae bacterium]|nr:hypothetical protein [Planctomycetaceae bacterium]